MSKRRGHTKTGWEPDGDARVPCRKIAARAGKTRGRNDKTREWPRTGRHHNEARGRRPRARCGRRQAEYRDRGRWTGHGHAGTKGFSPDSPARCRVWQPRGVAPGDDRREDGVVSRDLSGDLGLVHQSR